MLNSTREGRTGVRATPQPNGTIDFELGLAGAGKWFTVTGGPFDAMPYTSADFGVCVRAEAVPAFADEKVPIEDFGVPADKELLTEALLRTFMAAIDGRKVYVGCMGGWGRTGLFLALMAKAAGVLDPVDYVRREYTSRAVETARQELFVDQFDVRELRRAINAYAWRAFFKSWLQFFTPWSRFSN